MSDLLLNEFLLTRQRVDQLERIEQGGGAYLTLTRTSTLSVASTGTTITWQSEVRNRGFTWSGTTITIPRDGYYLLDMAWRFDVAATYLPIIFVNGINLGITTVYYGIGTRGRIMAMRYYTAGDDVEIEITPSATRTMQVTAYDSANESPFLHIVKL
jgi:hypothetical protein